MPTTLDPDTSTGGQAVWRGRALVPGAVGVVVLLAIGIAIGNHLHHNTSKTPAAGKATVTTAAPTPSNSASTAPGLVRGPAAVGAGGTSAVYGVPVGYQHTKTGAIDAATNYAVGLSSPTRYNAAGRSALASAILLDPTDPELAGTPQSLAAAEKSLSVNDSGQVVNADGSANPALRLYANLYPQWGAYKVTSATADRVTVQVWAPWVFGPGSDEDTRQIKTTWTDALATVIWSQGDWKLTDSPAVTGSTPVPQDAKSPSTSFAERRTLLPGWTLYNDATEQPWQYPGQVLS